jgi:prepilin-type N-terminal cleavage/methylation domain-containing protein
LELPGDPCERKRTVKGCGEDMRERRNNETGFTLVELLIVMSIVSLSLLIANSSYISFRESSALNRAARVVAADAALTRSYAIRNRTAVALVADETNRSYVIRDGAGNVYLDRVFDVASEMGLDRLEVSSPGDSIAFNSRGMLTLGSATIDVGRSGNSRLVTFNAIGRWRITTN